MTLLEERQKRIEDAAALREPDRVPIVTIGQCFSLFNAGYTIADAVYDFDIYEETTLKFMAEYEPDSGGGGVSIAGQGPILELMKPKNLVWPGAPDGRISRSSIQQFIEYAVLQEEDMDFFMADFTGWMLKKGFPAVSTLLEPVAGWTFNRRHIDSSIQGIVNMLSTPETREMMQTIWEISDMMAEIGKRNKALGDKILEMGFPSFDGGMAMVPFDAYSDFYRGTLDTMMDLYEHPDVIEHFIERNLAVVLESITEQAERFPGKRINMALHKGMDGFLTEKQYVDYYWRHLQTIINHIIDVGMTPFIYTEGPYTSRIKHLADVPKGKVIYFFEEVDPVYAKQQLGDVACIQGVFPVYLLHYGKKQEVIDEAKRLIDILAPGGGYIFCSSAGFDKAIPENVEAMFDTVKTYGKK